MWTLGWLICISKACSQANYLLLLGIREPWEGQCPPTTPTPTRVRKALRCQSIRKYRKNIPDSSHEPV